MSRKRDERSKATTGTKKGSVFERDVARFLSLWWGDDKDLGAKELSFRRSPGSGGVDPQEWPGDVIPTRRIVHKWPLVVECKAQDSEFGDLIELLSAPKSRFWDWIDQVKRDAQGVGRSWFLFVRRVRYPWLLVLDVRDWLKVRAVVQDVARLTHFRLTREDRQVNAIIVRADQFFDLVTPDDLLSVLTIRETRL